MRKLIFSKFNNRYDTSAKPENRSWKEWIEIFSKHEVAECDDTNKEELEKHKDGACYVFGEIPPGKTHSNSTVLKANALILDIEDATDEQIERSLDSLVEYEYLLYSTYKHQARCLYIDPDDPALVQCVSRFRVILPLDSAILPQDFHACWKALDFLTHKITDRKTKNIGRLYYTPKTFDLEKSIVYHNSGKWLCPKTLKDMPTTKKETSTYTLKKLKNLLNFMPDNETTEDGLCLKTIKNNIIAGKPFAYEGDRHNAVLAMTMYIAKKTGQKKPSTALVKKLFKESIDVMQEKDPSSPDIEDVARCYDGAIGKVKEYQDELVSEKARDKQLRGQEPYDEDELLYIAEKQGWIPEDLDRHWIVQKGSSYYFLDQHGEYRGPYTKDEARPAAATILSRAPILLNEPTQKGYRRRGMIELVEEFGQVAQEVVVDLTKNYSSFDLKNLVMVEAARPIRRDLEPKYNKEFAKCLRILAGDKIEKLLDWLACVPDLSKLLCALYLGGYPGSLKSGLAFGLARLWHKGPPAEIDRILGDFTEDLVFCPLVLADEGLPKQWKGINITTKLRSMISTYQRTLSRKYLPPATLVGALRLILSANNEFLLKSTEVLSSADLHAVAQRFLYIEAPEAATRYVESMDHNVKREWFERDGIASHVLWLAEKRNVVPGKRFYVEGDVSHMHRMLISGSDYNAMVCQWLVYYLMQPNAIDVNNKKFVRVMDGKLLVNDQALYDGWSVFFPNTRKEPSVYKIGAALRAISTDEKIQLRVGNRRVRYRVVDLNNLFAWSDSSNVGDSATMEETLGWKEKTTNNTTSKILPIKDRLAKIAADKKKIDMDKRGV